MQCLACSSPAMARLPKVLAAVTDHVFTFKTASVDGSSIAIGLLNQFGQFFIAQEGLFSCLVGVIIADEAAN